MRQENFSRDLAKLIQLAARLGATHAREIAAAQIMVEDELAQLCREPRCQNYGSSANCPPHIGGPDVCRALLREYSRALVVKIEVPAEWMLSRERHDVFRLLHEIVAGVERSAVALGRRRAKAFASGGCKNLFCHSYPDCRVLANQGPCRHPDLARPSMSGLGVNVNRLVQSAGWNMNWIDPKTDQRKKATGSVVGLILIG